MLSLKTDAHSMGYLNLLAAPEGIFWLDETRTLSYQLCFSI
jgi:hypothetical protein